MPELVLYGIRLLAKQFLGAILDIEVDQSGVFMTKESWCQLFVESPLGLGEDKSTRTETI